MIGLLTETIGNPTPIEIPFVPQRQLPSGDLPFPIAPQKWHFRQSIEYSITANRAVLDVASQHREDVPVQHLPDGAELDRARQHATPGRSYPQADRRRCNAAIAQGSAGRDAGGRRRRRGGRSADSRHRSPAKYYEMLRDPAMRDPRGYILPADQPDFLTATKFVNALLKTASPCIARRRRSRSAARVSRGLVRGEDGAGVPAARARHVRAAGSSRTTSSIRAGRRSRRTTTPAGRWPIRWASSSTASSKASTGRSRSVAGLLTPPPGTGDRDRPTRRAISSATGPTTPSSPSTGC